MEVSHDAPSSSVHSSHAGDMKAESASPVELNATMHHVIDTESFPFTAKPVDDDLNASVMIDPSNPFDEDMIRRMLSKLAQPLSSYKNCQYLKVDLPKICVRGSVHLGIVKARFFCRFILW